MSLLVERREPAGEPEGALVLFHGRGADEHDLAPLLEIVDPDRRLLGLTPRGPLSLPPGGAHWYVVQEVGYPEPQTFQATYRLVAEWLGSLEIPPERTVLGGFSQGAVMSLALGLGPGRQPPAAIVALSGFVPTVPGWEPDLERPIPPIAIGHGIYDQVISVEFARQARRLLEEAGAKVLYRESPMAHAIDPMFLGELRGWLAGILDLEPSLHTP